MRVPVRPPRHRATHRPARKGKRAPGRRSAFAARLTQMSRAMYDIVRDVQRSQEVPGVVLTGSRAPPARITRRCGPARVRCAWWRSRREHAQGPHAKTPPTGRSAPPPSPVPARCTPYRPGCVSCRFMPSTGLCRAGSRRNLFLLLKDLGFEDSPGIIPSR